MFQLEIFRLAQLAKPSRVRKSWSGAPRWLQMRRDYAVCKLCALTMRCQPTSAGANAAELNTLGLIPNAGLDPYDRDFEWLERPPTIQHR